MHSRTRLTIAAALIAATATAGVALAHDGAGSSDGVIDNAKITHTHHLDDHQHGGDDGHIASGSDNVTLVSKLALKNVEPGKIADVGVHKGYAYLAAWGGETCKYNGVHVVDIQNPAAPKEVAFVKSKEGSAPGEGVQALYIDTPKFKGDILVTNNETCNEKTGFGGLNIYNVTKPGSPTVLAEGFGDETVAGQGKKAANEIHSVFTWDAGDKAYAVIVDNDEGADVDIVDITDPKKPKLIAEHDLDEKFPQIVQPSPGNLTQIFHHDMIVKKVGSDFVMSVSYWDGGYVLLNVNDPANPTLIGDSDFADPDDELLFQTDLTEAPEGNAHQSEFTLDNQYLIGADEDFSPTGLRATDEDGSEFLAIPGDATGEIELGTALSGETVYVGRACTIDEPVPAGDGDQVAVVSRGECTFSEKIANVEAAGGYAAAIVVNRAGADACGPLAMSVVGTIPAFSVERSVGYDLFDIIGYDEQACLGGDPGAIESHLLPGVAVGTLGDEISVESFFDGWGYVRLFKAPLTANGGKLQQTDTYAIPEAMDPGNAHGAGDLSVHEVASSQNVANRAYLSYYSGGLRVIEIENDKIVEKGFFIDEGGNNFWGVQVFQSGGKEYVAASDRDLGLYIFEYTP